MEIKLSASVALAFIGLAAPHADAQCARQEVGGLVMIDVESVPTVSQWVEETIITAYSGTSYYRWDGPNYWGTPGNAILTYDVEISTPGTYELAVRNYHNHPTMTTLENDVWVRMDGSEWTKLYSPIAGTWSWYTIFGFEDDTSGPAEYALSAGTHQLELSARSTNFRIDRIHLALPGHPDPQNELLPQSPCAGDGPGTPFCFGVGCPCGNDDAGAGCQNSNGSGATLAATGTTSVNDDDLTLIASNLPANNSGLFFMGGGTFAPLNVGDGLACTGGLFRFLPSTVSGSGELSLSSVVAAAPPGFITIGDTRYFQAWTRDVLCGPPPAPCPSPCMNGSNLSHGLGITFTP